MGEGVFRHGVSSGDPTQDGVIIWTRVSGPGRREDPVGVEWTVAEDPALSDVVTSGTAVADPEADRTVHVDVGGLEPGHPYHYGFSALGERSPVGRTRTLSGAGAGRVRFAMVSCAKYSAGYFNAYARIADRADLDFLLHLGDYIYEVSNTPPPSQFPGADIGRDYDPPHECVTLADYRRRYAHYRLDTDLQRLHRTHPVIATVDDHDFADGVWRDGSVEHRPDRDGEWADRRAAAFRARWEWQPYRPPAPDDPERVFRTVEVGDLADLFLIDTRTRRDEPLGGPAMAAPARSQLGAEQRTWLLDGLRGSTARWRLLANSSVMGQIWDERLTAPARDGLRTLKMIAPGEDGPDPDQWDGYPAERDAILRCIAETGDGNTVVLSGDVHVGLAIDLRRDHRRDDQPPIAVELVTTSLTSQNVDEKRGWEPRTRSVPLELALVESVPHVHFADFDSHGYMLIEVTPERLAGEWWFVDTVLRPSDGETLGAAFAVDHGRPGLVPLTTGTS